MACINHPARETRYRLSAKPQTVICRVQRSKHARGRANGLNVPKLNFNLWTWNIELDLAGTVKSLHSVRQQFFEYCMLMTPCVGAALLDGVSHQGGVAVDDMGKLAIRHGYK